MFLQTKNKKGQGVVTGLVAGVVGLIILVIIGFIIVFTLTGANLFNDSRLSTLRINQTVVLNDTAQNFGFPALSDPVCTIGLVTNATGGETILTGNFTVSACTIVVLTSSYNNSNVNITSLTTSDGNAELTVNEMTNNLTTGVDNVAGKIPIIFAIAVVILIMGVLVILVIISRRSGLGFGGGQQSL